MGRAAVHARAEGAQRDSDAGETGRRGGHTESLRRRCGEAAGEKLGTAPVNRYVGNVGTLPGLPYSPASQAAARWLEGREVAGEHRRVVADARPGGGAGTGDPGQAASVDNRRS